MDDPPHTRFDAFCKADARTNVALGAAIGTTAQMVGMIRHGLRNPGRKTAIAIERLTNGAVRVADWPESAPTTRAKPGEAA